MENLRKYTKQTSQFDVDDQCDVTCDAIWTNDIILCNLVPKYDIINLHH